MISSWQCSLLCLSALSLALSLGCSRSEQEASKNKAEQPQDQSGESGVPEVNRAGYSGSDTCRQCHQEQFGSWHNSYHRTMTQWATAESVVAPFNNLRLEAYGREYVFTTEDGQLYVEMADPAWETRELRGGRDLTKADPPRRRFQVVMATGSHHLQTYWVATGPGDTLRQVPWVYHIDEQRWIPNEDSFLTPPPELSTKHPIAERAGHRLFQSWNSQCIRCHAVAGQTLQEKDGLKTRVAELGIACEACHGAGEMHVDYQKQLAAGKEVASPKPTIINPAKCDAKVSSQICGQCHADSHGTVGEYRPGMDLDLTNELSYFHAPHDPHRYWGDGTMRIAGREYLAMSESACFKQGQLQCLSCHSMHDYQDPSDQLAVQQTGDENCLQCHDSFRADISAHTHHASDSTGSRCYNCHMPFTSYGLFKAIRSHRIDSPSVTASVRHGRPNACNQCHADKSLGWTAKHLNEWYEIPSGEIPPEHQTYPATLFWLLKGDAAQRAIAAYSLQWEASKDAAGSNWQIPFLGLLLNDPYAVIRLIAFRALKQFGYESLEYDFLGGRDDRAKIAHDVIQHWSKSVATHGIPTPIKNLVDDRGQLTDVGKSLLDERDNTPVTLTE